MRFALAAILLLTLTACVARQADGNIVGPGSPGFSTGRSYADVGELIDALHRAPLD